MKKAILIFILILILPLIGCFENDRYPSYPSGGEYNGGSGGYGGGGGDYGGGYGGGYDDGCDWAYDAIGEWEGFLWEEYRSDGRPLSKKMLAMRASYSDTTYTYSGRHEWIKLDVLVDGRPVASSKSEISSSGYISFSSHKSGIDFEIYGRFRNNDAYGDIDLAWDEKVQNKYTGKLELRYVHIRGDYEMGRVHGSHWAAAWDLFDTCEDGIWDLPDVVFKAATLEGLAHLAEIEETFIRNPVQ